MRLVSTVTVVNFMAIQNITDITRDIVSVHFESNNGGYARFYPGDELSNDPGNEARFELINILIGLGIDIDIEIKKNEYYHILLYFSW